MSQERLSRRGYLAWLGSGAAATVALPAASAIEGQPAAAQEAQYSVSRDGNTCTVTGPEATYTIIYGEHHRETQSEKVPDETDALFPEFISDYVAHPRGAVTALERMPQYQEIMALAAEESLPVHLTDIHYDLERTHVHEYSALEYQQESLIEGGSGVSALGGGYLIQRSRDDGTGTGRIDAAVEGGLYGLAGWLLSPALTLAGRSISTVTGKWHGATATARKLSDDAHPELGEVALHLRNLTAAHTLEWYASEDSRHHPHYTTIWGALHTGLEQTLQYDADHRINRIDGILSGHTEEILSPETLYTGVRFRHKADEWHPEEQYTVPELAYAAAQHGLDQE